MTDGTENVKRLRALGNRRGVADRMEMRMEHDEASMQSAISNYENERLSAVPGSVAMGADLKPRSTRGSPSRMPI